MLVIMGTAQAQHVLTVRLAGLQMKRREKARHDGGWDVEGRGERGRFEIAKYQC